MKDKAILLFHGMGTHLGPSGGELGSFAKEFNTGVNGYLNLFENHSKDTIGSHVDIHEFNYSDWLDTVRKEMADKAKGMKDRLGAIGVAYDVSVPIDLAGKLVSFEAKFGGDDFFYTHWLDVIFYASMLGSAIRTKAGLKIAELVERYGPGNVHIIAHSLGTAVAHDTIDRLYRPEFDPNDGIPDLDPLANRLGSIWMFASVSGLVNSITKFSDPYKSIVKPGDDGCANSFVNVRHELDPFTWIAKFDPKNDGAWVDTSTFTNFYKEISTNLVVDGNTHSIVQYLQDPSVAEVLLYRFIKPLKVPVTEYDVVKNQYTQKTINGAYAALAESLKLLSRNDIATWNDFLDSAKALKDIAGKIKSDLA